MTRNLSGIWIGAYKYPVGSLFPATPQAVSFRADIRDLGGAFTGQVDEDGGPPSSLRGTREGASVTFSKRYAHSGGGLYRDRIIYNGDVNEDATRIDGEWRIPGFEHTPGEFFMMRDKPPEQEVQQETYMETD